MLEQATEKERNWWQRLLWRVDQSVCILVRRVQILFRRVRRKIKRPLTLNDTHRERTGTILYQQERYQGGYYGTVVP